MRLTVTSTIESYRPQPSRIIDDRINTLLRALGDKKKKNVHHTVYITITYFYVLELLTHTTVAFENLLDMESRAKNPALVWYRLVVAITRRLPRTNWYLHEEAVCL